MKKWLALLLAALMLLSFAACTAEDSKEDPPASGQEDVSNPGQEDASTPEATGPVAEEVKGVTIPAFSVTVNGVAVTQDQMAAYPMYSVQSFSINSSGTESTTTYVGFAIKDVCAAAGLAENYIWIEAAADDGYAVTLTGEDIMANTTLLAMTKDGTPFTASPWFAPCTDQVSGDYIKGCVSILVNTVEEKPEINVESQPAEGEEPELTDELPEISDKTDKVTFQPFSFKVNGEEVTNEKLEGLSIYKISPVTVNSKGGVNENTYTGYKLADVLAACGVKEFTVVKAVANDGYENGLSVELAASDYTLVAIEKDKELGEDGTIWVAPCSEKESKAYAKLVVEIIAE